VTTLSYAGVFSYTFLARSLYVLLFLSSFLG